MAEPERADSVVAYVACHRRRSRTRTLPENCGRTLCDADALGKLQRLRGVRRFPRAARKTERCGRGRRLYDRQSARGGVYRGDEKRQTRFLPEAADAHDL